MIETLLAFVLVTGAVSGGQEEPLELELFRTRAAAGLTAVDAIAEMDPTGLFEESRCTYGVEVAVFDSAGAEIVRDQWRRSADCTVFRADPAARVIDTFAFAVRPGRYTVEMSVTPGSGGAGRTARQALEALPADARASDLYLAREVGWTDSTDASAWAVRKGQLGIAAEAVLQIPTTRPFLGYYLELYEPGQVAEHGVVSATIRRLDGGRIAEFTLQQIERLDSDRPIAGTVSLTGLPPGSYQLDVAVRFDDQPELVRSHPFEVVRSAPGAGAAPEGSRPDDLEEYFQSLEDAELRRFDAVAVWLGSEEARRTLASLTPEGRRQYLAEFFRRSAVEAGGETITGVDALRVFLERLRQAEQFTERAGQDQQPAWQTDRGRIVLLRGLPDDRIQRPMPRNNTRPYEIWYYNIGSGYVYLFADESGFGHYRLLYTTDPSMATLPDWARRVGPDAVAELRTYYGIREDF